MHDPLSSENDGIARGVKLATNEREMEFCDEQVSAIATLERKEMKANFNWR